MIVQTRPQAVPAVSVVRRPVAVIVSRFPLLTETFILREVLELQRQGQPVRLVPLIHEKADVAHPEARFLSDDVLCTPFSLVLAANLRSLRRAPRRYGAVLAQVLWGMRGSAEFLLKTLVLWPKAVYLAQRLASEDIRHIHAHYATHPATVALIISRLTSISYSFTAHAHDIFVRRDFLPAKIRGARFVRLISEFNRRYLMHHYGGVLQNKAHVIHVGVEVECYAGTPPAPPAGGVPRLLCVAALQAYKGIPVLLEACAELRETGLRFRCDIIGDGPLRARLGRQIARRGLQNVVRLLGGRTQEEVAAQLRRADIVVLPSVIARNGQMEGIPVALMEAMAARKPVVAPALSGIPELVDDGATGLLFEPGNAGQLAAAVRWLLAEPALGRRLGKQGRRKVEGAFRLQATASRLLALFDRENGHWEADDVELARLAATALDRPGAAVGIRRRHVRSESRILHVTVGGPGPIRRLVIKEHRSVAGDPYPAVRRARREFQVLSLLAGGDLAGRPPAPKPLLWDERHGAIVMESCTGRSLSNLIRARRVHAGARAFLTAAFHRTGRWLGGFQDGAPAAPGADGPACMRSLLGQAKAHLDICRRQGCFSDGQAAGIREELDALAARIPHAALRPIGRHGDFWPGNVYIDDDHVQVIDFEGWGVGLPAEDVAYFLIQAHLFFAFPLLARPYRRLEQAFLSGYLSGGAPVLDPAQFKLGRLAAVLEILRRSYLSPAGARPMVRYRRRCLRRLALGAAT